MPLVDSDGSNEDAMVRASFVLFEREVRDVAVDKEDPDAREVGDVWVAAQPGRGAAYR